MSTENAVSLVLHTALYIDQQNINAQMHFIDYSNTINIFSTMPLTTQSTIGTPGSQNTPVRLNVWCCHWQTKCCVPGEACLPFHHNEHGSTTGLYVDLYPLFFSLYMEKNSIVKQNMYKTVIKFADNSIFVGRITKNTLPYKPDCKCYKWDDLGLQNVEALHPSSHQPQ